MHILETTGLARVLHEAPRGPIPWGSRAERGAAGSPGRGRGGHGTGASKGRGCTSEPMRGSALHTPYNAFF